MHVSCRHIFQVFICLLAVLDQDTDGNAPRVTVERASSSLLIYEDTMLYIDKEIKLKWQEVNETFFGTFEEGLEQYEVYMNIDKYDMYQIAWKYPAIPCTDMIHWIISHIDPETMTLNSVSGTKIETLWECDYDEMY